MASRDLTLIMRLRRDREKNKREIDGLRKEIETMYKNLNKGATFGAEFDKGIKVALTSVKKLNTEIRKFIKALNELGGGAAGINKFEKGLVKANENIAKLARNSRIAKKEINGLGAGGEGEMRKLSGALGTATNDIHTMMTMTMQTQKHSDQLSGALNTNADQFYKVSGSVRGLSSGIGIFTTKTQETLSLLPRLNIQLTALEKKIRDIQVIGKMKKILEFSQEISSVKVFQKELIKLRSDLASVYREQSKAQQYGVTQKMINEYKKIQAEVQKYKASLSELPALLKKYGAHYKEFEKVKNAAKGATKGLNTYATQMAEGTYKVTGSLDKLVSKTLETRTKVVNALRSIGAEGMIETLVKVKGFEQAYSLALENTGAKTQKFETLVKRLEGQMNVSWKKMTASVLNFARTETGAHERVAKDFNQISQVSEKLSGRIIELENLYRELAASTTLLGKGFKFTSEAMNMNNSIMAKGLALSKILIGVNRTRVKSIMDNTNALYGHTAAVRSVMGPVTSLAGSFKILNQEEVALNAATKNLQNSEYLLSKKVELARNKVQSLTNTMIQLHKVMIMASKRTKTGAATIKGAEHALGKLAIKTNIATTNLRILERELGRISNSSADMNRAIERVSAEGFANMIISQAAWMAGFQVIFGTLDKFKKALMSVAQLQEGVVRAMRSARSETKSYTQIFNLFSEAMSRARSRTGATFEDLGEILYQLGSAGLSAEEALAALDSTLANIIGTEAEARGITKLIAGLYLNFADQVLKVDGRVVGLSEVMKEQNQALSESITLTEKFVYINDLLVVAFNYAQVEMDELRDGLKFMAQSGRAANLALDEMVGILSFLNNHLIKAGTAGRAMRVMLSKITKDAKGFEEAFDIKIDMNKPLDFLDIMTKVNAKYGEGIISIERLGMIFKKLGLRGAEAFNLIQRNIGEVKETIAILRRDAEGAANEMQRIRLSDIASQAKIAAANLEGLIRRGFTPLMETVGVSIGVFNELAQAVSKTDDKNGEFISTAMKWGGVALSALAMGIAFAKAGAVFSWMTTVIFKLGEGFSRMGVKQENAITTSQRFSNVMGKAKQGIQGYAGGVGLMAHNMWTLDKATGGYNLVAKKQIAVLGKLKAAWLGLHLVLKAGIIIMAALIAMEIIKYYDQTLDRLRQIQKEYKRTADSTVSYINNLLMLKESIKDQEKITDENKATVKKLADETGLLNTKFKNESEKIQAVIGATEELVETQKKLLKVQKEFAISAELDVLEKELSNIEWWGRKNITTWEKFKVLLGKLFEMSTLDFFITKIRKLWILITEGKLGILKDDAIALGEAMTKLTSKTKLLENQIERLGELRAQTSNQESRDFINLQIKLAYQELGLTKEKILAIQNEKKAKEALLVTEARRKGIITDTINEEQRSLDVMGEWQKFKEKHYAEILDSRSLMSQIDTIGNAFGALERDGVDAFDEILRASKNMVDNAGIEKWSVEARDVMNTMKETSYGSKDFQKNWQEFNKILETGVKNVQALCSEIVELSNKQKTLTEEMEKLDLSNHIFMYDLLGTSINSVESNLGELISATSTLKTKEDEARQSVISAKADLYKLSQAMRAASSEGDEYNNTREDWIAQSKVVRIMQGRERRARYEADKQVGIGIRSAKEMSDRTEKYIRTEEDLKIALAKASAEMRKAKDGSDEYNKARGNYLAISKAIRDAHREVSRATNEETFNKLKLQGEYGKIINKVVKLKEEYAKSTGTIDAQIQKNNDLIASRMKTIKNLEKNKQLEQDNMELVKNKQDLLKKVYENELKQIDLRRKADPAAISAAQAIIQKEQATIKYQEGSLKLQADIDKAKKNERIINETLNEEYARQEEEKREQIRQTIKTFDELKASYAEWMSKIKEGITISFNYKEAAEDFQKNVIDRFFGGEPYEVKWVWKPMGGVAPPGVKGSTTKTEGASGTGAAATEYFGGIIHKTNGGLIPARVTAGEGYVPPNQVLGNINRLNSLNGGNATGPIPRAISRFNGPGGVDNIPTYLPSGSYVLSKKGMDAYEKSAQQGAKTFAEGGEVTDDKAFEDTDLPNIGSFTINVQKGSQVSSYPVHGEVSVLQRLKSDLEEEKMTRLN